MVVPVDDVILAVAAAEELPDLFADEFVAHVLAHILLQVSIVEFGLKLPIISASEELLGVQFEEIFVLDRTRVRFFAVVCIVSGTRVL